MIKSVIIEDSAFARIELKNLILKNERIELLGEADNGKDGIQLIKTTKPDLIFLDIHLPDMDGFELLNEISVVPKIIFTTAYDEYAIKSFDYNTIDYLLKPVKEERLNKAIAKIETTLGEKKVFSLKHSLFIKDGDQCWVAHLEDVALFHTEGNYTKVFFKNESPLLHKPLNQIEKGLDDTFFFRANRQQIVNIKHIVKIDKWFKGKLKITLKNGEEVEVSERQSVKFKQKLSF